VCVCVCGYLCVHVCAVCVCMEALLQAICVVFFNSMFRCLSLLLSLLFIVFLT